MIAYQLLFYIVLGLYSYTPIRSKPALPPPLPPGAMATWVYPPLAPDQLKLKEEESLVGDLIPNSNKSPILLFLLLTDPILGKRTAMAPYVPARFISIPQGGSGGMRGTAGTQGAWLDSCAFVATVRKRERVCD